MSKEVKVDSPSRSSPKFPQPIFLPTRKFGPTMSTPDDEVTLWRDECTFERAAFPLPLEVRLATSWSRSAPRAPTSLSLPSRFCISYRPLSTIAASIIIDTPRIRSTDCARGHRREFSPHLHASRRPRWQRWQWRWRRRRRRRRRRQLDVSNEDRSSCRAYLCELPDEVRTTDTRVTRSPIQHDTTRHDTIRHDTRNGTTRHDTTRHGTARHTTERNTTQRLHDTRTR